MVVCCMIGISAVVIAILCVFIWLYIVSVKCSHKELVIESGIKP